MSVIDEHQADQFSAVLGSRRGAGSQPEEDDTAFHPEPAPEPVAGPRSLTDVERVEREELTRAYWESVDGPGFDKGDFIAAVGLVSFVLLFGLSVAGIVTGVS